jgi:hypothetical protein
VNTADSLLDVAIGLLTQPLPQGRNLAIITPGGSYGVISADACAALDLNVIPLSDDTISQFDRIFPPRWSRGNPVDPAGDRNFIAYMQAPEMLLKLPEVDALIFMGFDSFANFSSVFATISSKLSDSLIAIMKELSDLVPDDPLDEQGSDKQWMNKLIGRVVGVFFSFFGTSDPEEVKAFGRRQAELMANDTIAATLGERLATVFQEFKAGQVENIGELFGQIFQPLLDALLLNWIEAYRKPVITTSFMGQVPSVSPMGRYAYPFAEQAAFVLSKLVEYSEFLQREGIDPQNR